MVPLGTPLQNGQRVEIVAIKSGGPSRDWLNPAQGFLATSRARSKVKQWFAAQDEAEMLAEGRAIVTASCSVEGQTQANLEELATKLGLKKRRGDCFSRRRAARSACAPSTSRCAASAEPCRPSPRSRPARAAPAIAASWWSAWIS
jgi:(p)ppGpp synthase/HD superfamily hydrolase